MFCKLLLVLRVRRTPLEDLAGKYSFGAPKNQGKGYWAILVANILFASIASLPLNYLIRECGMESGAEVRTRHAEFISASNILLF